MKKLFSISILLFVCLIKISAQKGIDDLINAEKNFAAYSVANSTKEAFLKFLDSTGIVFDNGKPVNGIETWNKREKRPGVLNWFPQQHQGHGPSNHHRTIPLVQEVSTQQYGILTKMANGNFWLILV